MKRRLFMVVTLVVFALYFGQGRNFLFARPDSAKQQGLAYVSWQANQYLSPDSDTALDNLRKTGANWISLLVTVYQDTITSTIVHTTTATPLDAALIHVIDKAHSVGLKVMLKPHLDLASDPSHWRGQIGQGFTEGQWTTWFASYQELVSHYAQLAQDHGVDQFCIGTELSATQSRSAQWRAVGYEVRSLYSGPITYAANWGDESSIGWWDIVDFIGVDAYYPLTNKNNPTLGELVAAWSPYTDSLSSLASTWGKQILFTEIGYLSQDGANRHPWDYGTGGALDLQEQADAYRAALVSVFGQPWFAGMYWWAWGTNPLEGGTCDDGYTPHGKPAEEVLRDWYGGPPATISAGAPAEADRALIIFGDSLGSGWDDWSWNSTVDRFSTTPVFSGTRAISITIPAWGALALHHANLDTSPYYWLQFYVREATPRDVLRAYANDQADTELRYVSLCNYTGAASIQSATWTRVLIPLKDMLAANRLIQRVSIKNNSGQSMQFWIDEIKLIGGTWQSELPLVHR